MQKRHNGQLKDQNRMAKKRLIKGNNPMKIGNIILGCENGFEMLRFGDSSSTTDEKKFHNASMEYQMIE